MSGRLVWITETKRDALELLSESLPTAKSRSGYADICDAWDAAPADPAEAIAQWFFANFHGADEDPDSVRNGVDEILAALGVPDEARA